MPLEEASYCNFSLHWFILRADANPDGIKIVTLLPFVVMEGRW